MLNSFYSVAGKVLPMSSKQRIGMFLRNKLCTNADTADGLFFAGKCGTPNPWWHHLENQSNEEIFTPISTQAKNACKEIKASYGPVLERFGIEPSQFFLGSIKDDEAEALYQMVLENKPTLSYQVGTFVGYSAMIIAHALKANGTGRLVAVDPEIPHRTFCNPVDVARVMAKELQLENLIEFVHGWHSGPSGDNVGFGLKKQIPTNGVQVIAALPEKKIDFAFIDGDHSTGATMADLLIIKDYIEPGGVMLFHDVWSWPTVAQALSIFWHDIYYWVRGTPAYFSLDTRRGHDGLAAIRRVGNESWPNLQVSVIDSNQSPVQDAIVSLSTKNKEAKTGADGKVYFQFEVETGQVVQVSCDNYESAEVVVEEGTNGDLAQVVIEMK